MTEKFKSWYRWSCVLILACCLLFSETVTVKAAQQSCSVVIPVSADLKSDKEEDQTDIGMVLTAENEDVPMPEKTTLSILAGNGKGNGAFGPILYLEPGEYTYYISQTKGQDKTVRYDESIYEVTVRIINDDNGGLVSEIWAVRDSESNKTENISFMNVRKETEAVKTAVSDKVKTVSTVKTLKTADSPKTGDQTPLDVLIALLILSGMTAAAALALRKKKKTK